MAGSWTAGLCFFDGRAPLPARFRIRYLLLATASTAYCSLGLEAQAMGCEAVRCSVACHTCRICRRQSPMALLLRGCSALAGML